MSNAKRTTYSTKSKKPKAIVIETKAPVKKRTKKRQQPFLKQVLPKGTFAGLGSAAGSMFGPMGSAVGGGLGQLVSHITGFGDYHVNNNSLMQGGLSPLK